MTPNPPTVGQAKSEAKRLREDLAERGRTISHSQALEQIARRHGYRDWNTMRSSISDRPPPNFSKGGRVSGRYLSQPFAATVLSAEELRPGWYRLALHLDEAVDVVRFESFSNLRRRLHVEVGPMGRSQERTSDGRPHVELNL